MPLIAAPARPGNWLDTDQPLSDAVLADVAAAGYEGIWRYAPLPGNVSRWDISPGELSRICGTRKPDGQTLQCGIIQHPRSPANSDLSRHDPVQDVLCAVGWSVSAGYPMDAHLGLDFEGLKGATGELAAVNTPEVVILYGSRWAANRGQYSGLLYVGYDVPLTPQQLYDFEGFDSYWSDAGHQVVATRGCAISQGGGPDGGVMTIHGVRFDRDVLKPDLLGDVPMVATLQP